MERSLSEPHLRPRDLCAEKILSRGQLVHVLLILSQTREGCPMTLLPTSRP